MSLEVMDIDELCDICGYFTGNTDANSGYGCNHPDNEEYEMLWKDEDGYTHRGYDDDKDKPKTRQGKCYAFSCPIAYKCDLQDLAKYDKDTYNRIIKNNPGESEFHLELIADAYDIMLVDTDELKGGTQ